MDKRSKVEVSDSEKLKVLLQALDIEIEGPIDFEDVVSHVQEKMKVAQSATKILEEMQSLTQHVPGVFCGTKSSEGDPLHVIKDFMVEKMPRCGKFFALPLIPASDKYYARGVNGLIDYYHDTKALSKPFVAMAFLEILKKQGLPSPTSSGSGGGMEKSAVDLVSGKSRDYYSSWTLRPNPVERNNLGPAYLMLYEVARSKYWMWMLGQFVESVEQYKKDHPDFVLQDGAWDSLRTHLQQVWESDASKTLWSAQYKSRGATMNISIWPELTFKSCIWEPLVLLFILPYDQFNGVHSGYTPSHTTTHNNSSTITPSPVSYPLVGFQP